MDRGLPWAKSVPPGRSRISAVIQILRPSMERTLAVHRMLLGAGNGCGNSTTAGHEVIASLAHEQGVLPFPPFQPLIA